MEVRKYKNRNDVPHNDIEVLRTEDIINRLKKISIESECGDDFFVNINYLLDELEDESYS